MNLSDFRVGGRFKFREHCRRSAVSLSVSPLGQIQHTKYQEGIFTRKLTALFEGMHFAYIVSCYNVESLCLSCITNKDLLGSFKVEQ